MLKRSQGSDGPARQTRRAWILIVAVILGALAVATTIVLRNRAAAAAAVEVVTEDCEEKPAPTEFQVAECDAGPVAAPPARKENEK